MLVPSTFFVLLYAMAVVIAKEEGFNRANSNIQRSSDDSCTFFYKPCECKTYSPAGEVEIVCKNLTPRQVFEIFNQDVVPSSDITYFKFETSNPSGTDIPANLLGTRRVVSSIDLKWTGTSAEGELTVDRDAFRSSAETLLYINIDGFNVENLDWTFLSGFNHLLALETLNLISMKSFASLPTFGHNFTSFYAYDCTELIDVPKITRSFLTAELHNTTTDNESASRILNKFLKVNETLQRLTFDLVPLTFVPREVSMFSNLEFLIITRTNISFIQEGALNFESSFCSSENLRQINLKDNKIKTIFPGAFKGSYQYTIIHLENNQLTQLESSVFQPILEDIYSSTKGGLYVSNNYFECDCSIAWLVRDNRHLLDYLFGAVCSDSSFFTELDPERFSDCE